MAFEAKEERRLRAAGTYGELAPAGARRLAARWGLLQEGHSTFGDLGSGVGKLVAQAYLEWPGVARAFGVELSKSRAQRALEAWQALLLSDEVRKRLWSWSQGECRRDLLVFICFHIMLCEGLSDLRQLRNASVTPPKHAAGSPWTASKGPSRFMHGAHFTFMSSLWQFLHSTQATRATQQLIQHIQHYFL